MKRIFAVALISIAVCATALAQAPFNGNPPTNPSATMINPVPVNPGPAISFGAIGQPMVVSPAEGNVINVGAAFGFLAPYINSAIGALLSSLLSWVLYVAAKRFNIHISDSNRDALQTALMNQASSLIADGLVVMEGKKVTVQNADLAAAANAAIKSVPGAAAYFDITPEVVAQKIIDKIPQVPAGAALIAAAPGVVFPQPGNAA